MSSRCTRRGRSADSKRSPSSSASTWRSVLVPPCTARPAGLLTTIAQSSRYSTASRSSATSCGRARGAAPARRRRGGLGQRRHADRLARRDRVAGAGALAVDPDLPGAQQLFEPAVTEARIMPLEPAVEPAGAILRPHRDGGDAAHCVAVRSGALAQLVPVIEPLLDLALEAALGRAVEFAARDAVRENSSGRKTLPRSRGRRRSRCRSRACSSAGSARSGCASAASASRSRRAIARASPNAA